VGLYWKSFKGGYWFVCFKVQQMKYPKPQETIWTGKGKPPSGMLTTGKEQAEYLLGDVPDSSKQQNRQFRSNWVWFQRILSFLRN